jgi:galactokinase
LGILKAGLPIQSFRDISNADDIVPFKESMKPEVYDCSKYVVEEIDRTRKAGALLRQNDLKAFGQLMYATHEGLSKLYQVSCEELDYLVEQAKTNTAVIGARLMGGGFGGCTINIVQNESVESFIADISAAYKQQFNIEPEAYVMSISDGTTRLTV